jgi:hypothetical protein
MKKMIWFRFCSVPAAENVAVTDVSAFSVNVQAALPEHAPDHPEKILFALAISERETPVPCGKTAEHVPGQLIPDGVLVTVPDPLTVTVRVFPVLKFAVTLSAADIVTAQVLVPEQVPPQPAKKEFVAGVAVKVT